ncbi:DUF4118 domain-containing protein [Enemella dayhoffiae]|uniref:DUF4118 domain-containing protein n=1 Tax=Enemella dayhoffiae TaxID=2016507 RepID=UPI001594F5FA|nr:DUF4118 domain-containing protein [Enemella dayhoffiae]
MSTTGTLPRGELRVLLGAAPGVGKTFAMLNEGRRRAARGTDVVVAFVETHGRRLTAEQLAGLELIPRRRVTHSGAGFTEMDLDAVLARRPQVALVDELAHHNVPGSRNTRRCEDVEELLAAGIDVITTVNVQHLESLNDVVAQITGIRQRETVPDAVVRSADQIELVDMAPEALRRRMAHGNVYAPEKVDAALRNYFRPGNLAALRELALLWVADRVDAGLTAYRRTHAIDAPWATRERVLVALSGGPEGAHLVRRGARIASRGVGGELVAVYVARSDGLVDRDQARLGAQQRLVDDLSGSFQTVTGEDPAEAVLEHARSINATQIVVGLTRRRPWQRLFGAPVSQRIIEGSGDIDVHIVSHEEAGRGHGWHRTAELPRTRRLAGTLLALLLPVVLTILLAALPPEHVHQLALMVFLSSTVLVALVGGLVPAVLAAVASSLLVNWFFTPPLHTLTIADPANIASLAIFVLVGVAVATVVDRAATRTRRGAEARAEADTLLWLTSQTLGERLTVARVLDQVRRTFLLSGVQFRTREQATAPWRVVEQSGSPVGDPDSVLALDDNREFAVFGRGLTVAEQRVLAAFGVQVMNELERAGLAEQAAAAGELADRSAFQTALLAAVSHDLRTPLAAIKASSSSLLASDVELSAEDRRSLLDMVDDNADRLGRLIGNLLDMTRLQTGTMSVQSRPALLDEVVRPALVGLQDRVVFEQEPGLPLLQTDPGLAERMVANVVDNALRHQPADRPVRLCAGLVGGRDGGRIELRVSDNGPGVPPGRREQMFQPFQRLGDAPAGQGLGLGLAVVAGFARAIGATLEIDDTPGGGLTLVLGFPAGSDHD